MLENDKYNRDSLKETDTNNYLLHPPSHAVDGNLKTGFCISQVKKGSVIRINFPHAITDEKEVEVAFVVDRGARSILLAGASLQFLVGEQWVRANTWTLFIPSYRRLRRFIRMQPFLVLPLVWTCTSVADL